VLDIRYLDWESLQMPDGRAGLGRVREDVSGREVHVRIWAVGLDGQGLFPRSDRGGRVF